MLRNSYKVIITIYTILAVVGMSFPMPAFSAPNLEINYQGKLTGSTGAAVADGTYSIAFALYTAVSGGSSIWSETDNVAIKNGLFSVMLGENSSLAAVDFNQTLYLGVNVEGDGEMSPRKILGTVPSAFEAQRLDGLATTSFLRSDQADTASGLLTFTGGLVSTGSSTITDLTAVTATTTNFIINGERFTDLTGIGLSNDNGQLTVATSTLGLGDGTFLGLSDTPNSYTANRIPYMTGSALTTNAALTFDGVTFTTANASTTAVSVSSTAYFPGSGIWNSSGNVGIGTTSPGAKLHVLGNLANIATFQTPNASSAYVNFDETNGAGSMQLRLQSAGSTRWSFGNYGADDTFRIATSLVGSNDVFVIDRNGNVGIGTTTPAKKFEVWGANNTAAFYGGTTGSPIVEIGQDGTRRGYWRWQNAGQMDLVSEYGPLTFWTGPNGSETQKVTIDSTGNVGIGTTSPFAKLSVAGNTYLGGTLTATGTITFGSLTNGLLYANGSGVLSATSSLAASNIEDAYVRNTGDSISGALSFTGTTANIALGSNWLSGDGDDEGVFVDGSGNVGIGTSSPGHVLTALGNTAAFDAAASGDFRLYLNKTASSDVSSIIFSTGGAVTNNGWVELGTLATNDLYFKANASAGDYATTTMFLQGATGNVGVGTTTPQHRLSVVGGEAADGLYLGGIDPTFYLQDDAGTLWSTEARGDNFSICRFGISCNLTVLGSTGNVGIGTTTPTAKLAIENSTASQVGLIIKSTDNNSSNNSFEVQSSSGAVAMYVTAVGEGAYNKSLTVNSGNNTVTNGLFVKRTALFDSGATTQSAIQAYGRSGQTANIVQVGATTATGELFSIAANGNVGIGDTTPAYLLTVGNGDLFGVNSSGLALAPTGSNSAPSYSFTADTNTGIYSGAADTLKLVTGGSDRVTISGVNTTVSGNLSVPGTGLFAEQFGYNATATGTGALAIGYGTKATADYTTAVGQVAQATSAYSVAFGRAALATGGGSVAIGYSASAADKGSISIGRTAAASNANQFVAGSVTPGYDLREVVFGMGAENAWANLYGGVTIRGTNGLGTDIAGANLKLAGGQSTGAASGGTLSFQTAAAGSSGSSLNALTTRMTILSSGNVGIGTTSPFATLSVAGSAAITGALYDNNASAGANGSILQSTGSGFAWVATSTLGFNNHDSVTLTGEDYLSLSGQQITANAINPDNLAAADFGDFTCNGTTCDLDTNSVADNEIDYTNVTLSDFTDDVGYLTDITGESFLDLADTPASYTANRLLYTDASSVTSDADLTFDGSQLTLGGTGLSLSGTTANIALGSNWLSGDGDDEGVFVDGSGNVGIGTSTPNELLQVGASGVAARQGIYVPGRLNFAGAYLKSEASNGTGASLELAAHIDANISRSWKIAHSAQTYGTNDLVFAFADNATDYSSLSYSEMMRLTRQGNLGIGTTSPSAKLDVVGDILAERGNINVLRTLTLGGAKQGSGVDYARLDFQNYDSNNSATDYIGARISSQNTSGADAGDLRFWTANAATLAERMTIIQTGNVGIGDTSPAYLLTVGNGDLFGVNSSGITLAPTGSASAPSYSFTADTNTGLYSDAADTLKLVTGGSDRLTINSSGNVGIGTTTPVAPLAIYSSDSQADNPIINLTKVDATVNTGGWDIGLGDSGQYDGYFYIKRNGQSAPGDFYMTNSGTGVFGQGAAITDGQGLKSNTSGSLAYYKPFDGSTKGEISFRGAAPGNATFNFQGYSNDGTWHAQNILTLTASSTAGNTIYLNGNVGIGTTSPGAKLDIYASGAGALRIDRNAAAIASMMFRNTAGSMYVGIDNDADFAIRNVADINAANHFTVQQSGNVGIGTTTPGSKLSVSGSTYLGGNLAATGTVQLTNITNGFLVADNSGNVTASSSIGIHDSVTLTGEDYLSLSGQQITADAINPDNLASADFGDFTCNGTTCGLDTGSVTTTTVLDDTLTFADVNYGDTLASNPSYGVNETYFGSTGLIFEGSVADTFEGLLTATVTGSDKTWTLPNTTGTIALTSSAMTGTFDGNNFAGGAIGAGDLLYGSAAGTISELAGAATGNVLLSGGATGAPAWGKVDLTSHITGTLPVGNGGTGATTLTGLLMGNGTAAFTATTSLSSTYIEDAYVRNTGDSISGALSFTGTAANIALGSNWLSGDGDDEGVFVTSDGNVGIGTTTPAKTLDVLGSLRVGTGIVNTASLAREPFTFTETLDSSSDQSNVMFSITNNSNTTCVNDDYCNESHLGLLSQMTGTSTQDYYRRYIKFGGVSDTGVRNFDWYTGANAAHRFILYDALDAVHRLKFDTAGDTYVNSGSGDTRIAFNLNDGGTGGLSVYDGGSTILFDIGSGGEVGVGGSPTTGQGLTINEFANAIRAEYSGGPVFNLVRTDADAAITSGNQLGALSFKGIDDNEQIGARLIAQAEGTWSSSASPGRLLFYTTPSGSVTPAEVVRITSAGNVGIGDASPASLLTVGNGDLFQVNSSGIALTPTGSNSAPSYSFTADTNTGLYSGAADTLKLVTGGSDRVTVTSAGSVGIGTSTPQQTLSVMGNAEFYNDNAGDAYNSVGINAKATSGYVGTDITFRMNDGTNTTNLYGFGAEVNDVTDLSTRDFWIYDSVAGKYRMALNNTGDWGIGGDITPGTLSGSALTVLSGGSVGVGTTTPVGRFDIKTTTRDSATGGLRILDALEDEPRLSIYTSGGSGSVIANQQTVGAMQFNSYEYHFKDQAGTSDYVTIANDGHIGIGTTTTSDAIVTIQQTGGGKGIKLIRTDNGNGVAFDNTGSNPGLVFTRSNIDSWRLTSENTNTFSIQHVNNSNFEPYQVFRSAGVYTSEFDSTTFSFKTGNVGIGDASPASLLTVGNGDLFQVNSSGIALAPTGSNSAPSYSFTADTNTGLYSGAADTLKLVTDGSDRLTIKSNGNVGVGTSDPDSSLHISNASGADVILYRDDVGIATDEKLGAIKFGGLDISDTNEVASIGAYANTSWATSDNPSSYLVFKTTGFDTGSLEERVRIDAGGDVGIGNADPDTKLHVGSSTVTDGTNLLKLEDANSTCVFNANTGSPTCGSDITLKKDVREITDELTIITALNPKFYHWKTEDSSAALQSGFIAQDVQKILPELVQQNTWVDGSERLFLNIQGMMPYVVGAIGEQQRSIDELLRTGSTTASTLFTDFSDGTSDTVWEKLVRLANQPEKATSTRANGAAFAVTSDTGKQLFTVKETGKIGIGTTVPTAQLHTTGSVRLAVLGAGSVTSDAKGNVITAASESLMQSESSYARGIEAIREINPVTYRWASSTGYDTTTTYAGFTAENVRTAIPEAVGTDALGHLTLSDRPIIAALVNATKEQQDYLDALFGASSTDLMIEVADDSLWNKLVELLGGFRDGVLALVGLTADRISTDQLCVGGDCISDLSDLTTNAMATTTVVSVAGSDTTSQSFYGTLTVDTGATTTKHMFPTEFVAEPNVTLTPRGQVSGGWWLAEVTEADFTVEFAEVQTNDIEFSWQAIGMVESETDEPTDESPAGESTSDGDNSDPDISPATGSSTPTTTPETADPTTETNTGEDISDSSSTTPAVIPSESESTPLVTDPEPAPTPVETPEPAPTPEPTSETNPTPTPEPTPVPAAGTGE